MAESRRIRGSGKVLRDPIHRLIRIDQEDEFILDLIDTPEFQRLRRIRQLGVSYLTYPGAEHSRFVHSLGVFNFAQRILESLLIRYRKTEVESYLIEYRQVVLAAALLHDIGHGPFSHVIERAFKKGRRHEARTSEIIRDESSGVGRVLKDLPFKADDVASIIDETTTHYLLKDIVSSQLDADRMDYLLRDGYAAGVVYGAYDPDWLLNTMCVGLDPNANGYSVERLRLCLDDKRGQYAAEQFILARSHMNSQVYFHRVTRGYEVLLLNLFEIASKEHDNLPNATPQVIKNFLGNQSLVDSADWISFDESTCLAAFHTWAQSGSGELSRLSKAFLHRERIYSSRGIPESFHTKILELAEDLQRAGLKQDVDWHIDDNQWTVYKGLKMSAAGSIDPEEQSAESILLSSGKPSDRAEPLDVRSHLMSGLDQRRENSDRLYFDRSKKKLFEPVLKNIGLVD